MIQTIPHTSETLALTDIATPGYLYLKNLSATYEVAIDKTPAVADTALIRLKPVEFAMIPTRRGAAGDLLAAICATDAQTVALQIVCVEL